MRYEMEARLAEEFYLERVMVMHSYDRMMTVRRPDHDHVVEQYARAQQMEHHVIEKAQRSSAVYRDATQDLRTRIAQINDRAQSAYARQSLSSVQAFMEGILERPLSVEDTELYER